MKPLWHVYILECLDNSLYTGITNNLENRIQAHKTGKGAKYTKAKGFKKILHSKSFKTKSEALKIEYKIKQLKKENKITFLKSF